MKKKLLSVLLCGAMTAGLLIGCGQEEAAPAEAPAAEETPAAEEAPAAAAAVPTDYKYYFSFDEADERVHSAGQFKAQTPIVQTLDDKEVVLVDGVKGKAAYADGASGFSLDVDGVGDAYTVAFWAFSKRYATYMPVVQFGPDIHGDFVGGEQWVNITTADFSGSGSDTFPSVWSYNVPEGFDRTGMDGEPGVIVGENAWVHIALSVDPAKMTADGTMIDADLYVNGVKVVEEDANGNVLSHPVVPGTMASADSFEFLMGINYWDAIFKGAYDELYIFDRALGEDEVAALYADGDPSVQLVIPEREITIKEDPDAVCTIGDTKLSGAFWSDWSEGIEIKEGEKKVITMSNYSDGLTSYDNYSVIFHSTQNKAHEDPNSVDGNVEYGVVRADAWGWGNADEGWKEVYDEKTNEPAADNTVTHTYTWDNWTNWQQNVMVEAKVVLEISRMDGNLLMKASDTSYDNLTTTCTSNIQLGLKEDAPVFVTITNEKCYNEILSVENGVVLTPNPDAVDAIGTVDLQIGFWADWTESIELADGDTKTVKLKNYSNAANNWENYVLVLSSTKSEAHKLPVDQDPTNYKEYAVLRADAYGWAAPEGDSAAAPDCYNFTTDFDDWVSWLNAMKGADVEITLSRKGGEVDIKMVDTGADGKAYTVTALIKNSALTKDAPVYFFFTNEKSYVELLSVE